MEAVARIALTGVAVLCVVGIITCTYRAIEWQIQRHEWKRADAGWQQRLVEAGLAHWEMGDCNNPRFALHDCSSTEIKHLKRILRDVLVRWEAAEAVRCADAFAYLSFYVGELHQEAAEAAKEINS